MMRLPRNSLKLLILAAFVILSILASDEYHLIQMLIRVICTSCIGLG